MENEHNNAVPEEKKPGYPMHKRKYTPLYTVIVFLYGLLVKLLFFMKIEGRENVPKDRNCILMGNHQCLLDPVTLALCVPDREIHFMGKKELFENKFLGWVFRQVHGFPVDRGNMDMTAIRTAMGVRLRDVLLRPVLCSQCANCHGKHKRESHQQSQTFFHVFFLLLSCSHV